MTDQFFKNGSDGTWAAVERVFALVAKAAAYLAGLTILAMVVLLLKELVFRNLGHSGTWTSETIDLLIMWAFLLPLAFSQMDGAMIRVTMVTAKYSPRVQVWFLILSSLSATIFGVLLFFAGYGFFANTVPGSYYPETGFPTIIQRAGVPLCSLLLSFSGVICTVRSIKGLKDPEEFIAQTSEAE